MDITRSIIDQRDKALVGGEYSSYRSQTSRRIHAIRKRLGAATPRGRKFLPKTTVTAEEVAKNPEWVQLLLTSSERAWANAMAMKSSQSPENTQKPMPGSTKRQIASRISKAVVYSGNLVKVLNDKTTTHATTSDILEAKAYLAMMKGSLAFEKSQWKKCLQEFSVARLIYIALGVNAKDDVFKDLLSSIVDPSIRYAAYQSQLPRTKPIPEIALESFPTSEAATREEIQEVNSTAFETTTDNTGVGGEAIKDLPTTISWRSRKVKLEDAAISNALGLAMMREYDISATFDRFQKGVVDQKTLAAAYDDIIDARQEAVDATRAAIDELHSEGVDPSDSRMQSLQITRTAVNYAVIEWRVGRNRILCGPEDGLAFQAEPSRRPVKESKDTQQRGPREESSGKKLSRLRERVALYDAILQSLDAVRELPGVAADTTFVDEITGKQSYFRALKCLAIGRSHVINDYATNALALFSRALTLAETASKSIAITLSRASASPPKLAIYPAQSSALTSTLSTLTTRTRALVCLHNLSASASKTPTGNAIYKPPLIENLSRFHHPDSIDLTNLVTYPPKLQPIPVKPLFFDLAWNYIQYPGRKTPAELGVNGTTGGATTEQKNKKEEERKKGWFGFGR